MMKFKSFFENYSKNVDKADQQYFWKLNDEIIFSILTKNLQPFLENSDVTILDAGGGTGRWIEKLLPISVCKFILVDNSSDMLERAKLNLNSELKNGRVTIYNNNLLELKNIESNSISSVISMYNPISFIDDTKKVFCEFYRVLKKNGIALIMGQNAHNAIYSKVNNYLCSSQELSQLSHTNYVSWNDSLPPLKVFSLESLHNYMTESYFKINGSFGIPIYAQPGPEDFDPSNKKQSAISNRLKEDCRFYNELLKIELDNNSNISLVNRGMNLLIIGSKT